MDRAVLERMVGAAVLLLLLVVVAPAILDGSRDEPTANVQPFESSGETRVETIVLDVAPGSADAEPLPVKPEPAPAPEVAPAVAAEPEPAQVAKPAPKPAPKSVPKPAPAPAPQVAAKPKPPPVQKAAPTSQPKTATASQYIVQLGIFSSSDNAEKFAAKIKARGFSVKQMTVPRESGNMYRVYVGPRATRAEADQLVAVMANSGYKGLITELTGGG